MKTYKINNVEVSADQIKEIIRNNPELLKENKGGRYFFPERGEWYWYVRTNGSIKNSQNFETLDDGEFIVQGVYRTQKEAELARDKQKTIVACWKWAQENAPFEPDWGDGDQKKFHVIIDLSGDRIVYDYMIYYQTQFTLPYFKSKKDCEAFIEANKEHLELLFKN